MECHNLHEDFLADITFNTHCTSLRILITWVYIIDVRLLSFAFHTILHTEKRIITQGCSKQLMNFSMKETALPFASHGLRDSTASCIKSHFQLTLSTPKGCRRLSAWGSFLIILLCLFKSCYARGCGIS